MKGKDILKSWLDGSVSDDELRSSIGDEEFDELKKLSNALHSFKPAPVDVERIWKRLQSARKNVRQLWIGRALRIAAIFLVVFGISYFLLDTSENTLKSIVAYNQTEVTLEDQTRVVLNTNSQINYKKEDFDRKILLKGEGLFEVASGVGFEIKTAQGVVTVLGTSFNIIDHEDGFFEITCFEGTVNVKLGRNKFDIRGGEGIRSIEGNIERINADSSRPSWIEGKSTFRSVPLKYVLREFERQFKIELELRTIDESRLFTGGFSHKDRLLALNSITQPFEIKFEIKDDVIILSRAE